MSQIPTLFCYLLDRESSNTKQINPSPSMRKTILIIVAVIISAMQFATYAQVTQKQLKERQELAKASKKELNEKVSKAARKEAKRLEKEKWQAAPGALPIEKQLDRSYMLQMQYDEDGFPMYVMGEGMSIGGNYDAAKMQALELAKQILPLQFRVR